MSVPSLESLLDQHRMGTGMTFYRGGGCKLPTCTCGETMHPNFHARHVAAAVEKAHTIRTIDGLNALPTMSVVRDASGAVFEYAPDGEGDVVWWYDSDPEDASDIELPALVIWCPAVEAEVQQ